MDESLLKPILDGWIIAKTIVIVDKSVWIEVGSDTLKLISLGHKVRPHIRMGRSLWLVVIGYPLPSRVPQFWQCYSDEHTVHTVGAAKNETLVFVNFSAQDASILKISVPIIKRRSWRFQNTPNLQSLDDFEPSYGTSKKAMLRENWRFTCILKLIESQNFYFL